MIAKSSFRVCTICTLTNLSAAFMRVAAQSWIGWWQELSRACACLFDRDSWGLGRKEALCLWHCRTSISSVYFCLRYWIFATPFDQFKHILSKENSMASVIYIYIYICELFLWYILNTNEICSRYLINCELEWDMHK